MTQKELTKLVGKIANKFNRCDDGQARFRAAEAVLHLVSACEGNTDMFEAILDMIDGYYTCYVYGEGIKEMTALDWVQSWKNTKHGEFLVKYSRKLAFGLCAEDSGIIEDYINEIVAYKKEHAA